MILTETELGVIVCTDKEFCRYLLDIEFDEADLLGGLGFE